MIRFPPIFNFEKSDFEASTQSKHIRWAKRISVLLLFHRTTLFIRYYDLSPNLSSPNQVHTMQVRPTYKFAARSSTRFFLYWANLYIGQTWLGELGLGELRLGRKIIDPIYPHSIPERNWSLSSCLQCR